MENEINLKLPIGIVIFAGLTKAYVCLPTVETWYMPSQYDLLTVISRKSKTQMPSAIIEVDDVDFCTQEEMPTKYSVRIEKMPGFSTNLDSHFRLIDTFNYKILKCNIIQSNLKEPVNIGDIVHFIQKDQNIQINTHGFSLGKIKTIEQLPLDQLPDFIFEYKTLFKANLLVLGALGTRKRTLVTEIVKKMYELQQYAFLVLDPTGIYSNRLKDMKFDVDEKPLSKIRADIKQSFGFNYMNEAEILNEMRTILSGDEFETLSTAVKQLKEAKLLRTQANIEHAIQELIDRQIEEFHQKLTKDDTNSPESVQKKLNEYNVRLKGLEASLFRKLKEKLRIEPIIQKNKITTVNFTKQMERHKEEDQNILVLLNEIFAEALRRNEEIHRLTEAEQKEKGVEKLNLVIIADKFENLCSNPSGINEDTLQKQLRDTVLNIISRSYDFQIAIIGVSSIPSLLYRDVFHLCDDIIISPESKYAEMKIFDELLGINMGITKRLIESQFIFIGEFTKNHPWIIKFEGEYENARN